MKNNAKANNSSEASTINEDLKKLKEMDVKKAVDLDLRAAIHFLCLLRDTPELLDAVKEKLEQLLSETVKLKESQPELPLK